MAAADHRAASLVGFRRNSGPDLSTCRMEQKAPRWRLYPQQNWSGWRPKSPTCMGP